MIRPPTPSWLGRVHSPVDTSPAQAQICGGGQAARQAAERGRAATEEVTRLLVHGVLHLLGYDHAKREEARRMRAREDALAGDTDAH